ncbi:MAG: hypothetical protein GY942_07550, partial [Aestuariibacter sp.]|nr:hypothetical protein [Aestuariibacter sp.]
GGSGGSIWIETPVISGSGTIQANGGAGGDTTDDGGGGSGGRIALHSSNNSFSGAYEATGGSSSRFGGAGTIYVTDGISAGDLLIDNGGNGSSSAALPAGEYTFDNIILSGEGDLTFLEPTSVVTLTNSNLSGDGTGRLVVQGNIIAPADFTIDGAFVAVQGQLSGPEDITTTGSGGLELYASTPWHSGVYTFNSLTVGDNTALLARAYVTNDGDDSDDYGIELRLNDLVIESGGTVQAGGLGYAEGNGPGTPAARDGSSVGAAGAGHGGFGGQGGGNTSAIGSPYGDPFQPTTLGSGGGNGDDVGGSGGGAIHLVVSNSLVVDGLISANGLDGSSFSFDGAGGGSGGSIWIETPVISGSGTIQANGGAGGDTTDDGGGGSGGRIALHS